jgi:hypothetical protein
VVRAVAVLCLLCGCDKLFGLNEIAADGAGSATIDAPDRAAPQVSYTARAATTAIDVPFATPPPSGALMIALVATFQNNLDAVTDNANNSYLATPVYPATSAGGSQLWVLYATTGNTTQNFNVHIATHATSADPTNSETSAVVLAYPGPFSASPLDLATSHAGQGSGSPVVQDCGMVATSPGEIVVAGVSHDFQGMTTAGSGYQLRAIAAEDYLTYATLAVEDAAAHAAMSAPTFTTTLQTGIPAWVCATVTFH